jgi:tripartite ATP-independent transporter DctP family solute receptor
MHKRKDIQGRLTRRSALALGAGVMLSAPFIGRAVAQAKTLRVGSSSPLEDAHTLAMVKFKEEVEAKSGNRMTVTIFPNSQLGNEDAMVNQVRAGALDGMITDAGVLSQAVPEMDLFTMPFLFDSLAHAVRVGQSDVGKEIADKVAQTLNVELLGWGTDGARNMFNAKRQISKPEDVAGLKMRVQQTPVHIKIYETLKALPTPIAFAELYGALQTGVVDGADVSMVDMLSLKFYQVTKYLSLTNHQVVIAPVIMSKVTLEGLSDADREIVVAAAAAGAAAQAQATIDREANAVGELKGFGLEVLESPDKKAFADLMGPVYELGAERFGADLIKRAQAVT